MLNGDAVPEAQQQAKNGSSGCEPFFESGQAAMSIEVRGNLPGLMQSIGNKFEYNVVPMPSITGATASRSIPTGGGSLGWALAPNAVHGNRSRSRSCSYLYSAEGPGRRREDVRRRAGSRFAQRTERSLAATDGGPGKQRGLRDRREYGDDRPADPGHRVHALEHRHPECGQAATIGDQSHQEAMTNLQSADGRRLQAPERLARGRSKLSCRKVRTAGSKLSGPFTLSSLVRGTEILSPSSRKPRCDLVVTQIPQMPNTTVAANVAVGPCAAAAQRRPRRGADDRAEPDPVHGLRRRPGRRPACCSASRPGTSPMGSRSGSGSRTIDGCPRSARLASPSRRP